MIFCYLTGLATGIAASLLYRILRKTFTQRFERCVVGAVPRLVMSNSAGEATYAMTSPGSWHDVDTGKAAGAYVTLGRNAELTALYIAHKNDEAKP